MLKSKVKTMPICFSDIKRNIHYEFVLNSQPSILSSFGMFWQCTNSSAIQVDPASWQCAFWHSTFIKLIFL